MPKSSRFVAFVAAALSAASAIAACSSDDSPASPAPDGGLDATLLSDSEPPKDVTIPLGNLCGNASGLAPNSSWPMRGGCPKRAGTRDGSGPGGATIDFTIAIAGSKSTPVTDANGLIWVGSSTGDIYALRRNGDIQSTFHVAGGVDSSAAVDKDGHTIFAGHDGTLYAFAQAFPQVDGGPDASVDEAGVPVSRVIVSKAIGDSGESPAIGADGTIYVGTHDGKMNAISADFSTVKWSTSVGGDASATLSADGTIYAGSSDHKVYALDASGAVKWSVETGDAIVAPVAVGGDETIYAASTDGKLYAIDPAGKTKWTYAAAGPLRSTPAVLGGVVYVGSDDKRLHAVHSDTGAPKWTYQTLGAVASPVVTTDETVYVGSADGHVYAITPGGSLYLAINVKGAVTGPPAFGSDGAMYVATSNGIVGISR